MTLLAFEDVVKHDRDGADRVRVLDGITLSVAPGEFVTVEAAPGPGRSALLQLAAGLDAPTSGRVLFLGEDVATLTGAGLHEFRRRVSVLYDRFNLLPGLTVEDNVAAVLCLQGVAPDEARARAIDLLTRLRVEDRARSLVEELSESEMQRASLARALAPRPSLLLADEPAAELGRAGAEHVLALIGGLSRSDGMAILATTGSGRVSAFADRVLVLEHGRLRGTPRRASGIRGERRS